MFISKRNLSLLALFVFVLQLFAQGPNNTGTYYKAATGKKGQALKTALFQIITSMMTLAIGAYTNVTSRQTDVLTARCGTYTLAPLISRSLTM